MPTKNVKRIIVRMDLEESKPEIDKKETIKETKDMEKGNEGKEKERRKEEKVKEKEEIEKIKTKRAKKTDRGAIIERFIVPMLQFQPLQPMQPLPIEPAENFNISELRQLLSNEKARILATIKTKKPLSLYHLAKLLNRDFKAVREDVKILEKFGFVKLLTEKEGKKKKLRPVLVTNKLEVMIEVWCKHLCLHGTSTSKSSGRSD